MDARIDCTEELAGQLEWYWTTIGRPRLTGLSDEEYLWQPVPDCWTIRVDADPPTIDRAFPAPEPPPVTTIAWRLGHVIVGVFAMRTAGHFGGPPADYATWPWATTANEALTQLDTAYAAWLAGIRSLTPAQLAAECGPAERPCAEMPMATLVLHLNREVFHHLAEVALLRDLWAHGLR
jgi:hypothetical protein